MRHPIQIELVQARLIDRGVWLRPFGRLLYTMPPYVTTNDDLTTVTKAMVEIARSPTNTSPAETSPP